MSSWKAIAFSCAASLVSFSLISCSTGPATLIPPHSRPAVKHTQLTFVETSIPQDCEVFAHLLIAAPASYTADQIRQSIEQFGAEHGADLMLLGLARQAAVDPAEVVFSSYGPQTPYSFKQSWSGWKFGFTDWNKGGPLLDYGMNHLSGTQAPFTIPISIQGALLSCPSLRGS